MAAKDLHTMIRIRKWDVDEKQRALGVLLRREESIIDGQKALDAEMKRESVLVGKAEVTQRFTYSAYLARCAVRKEEMAAALVEVRRLIDEAREELAETYRRLKTFEVTQEARDEAEAKEEDRLEQMDLDEIGLTLHRRKV